MLVFSDPGADFNGGTDLRLNSDYPEAHNNLGMAFAMMPGQLPAAIAHYEAALRLKPDFVEVRNNLAAIYVETGRIDAAIEQLEIAARFDPTSPVIRYNLEKLKARRR